MKEKINTFFKKVKASATVAGEYAGKKATEIGEKTSDAFNISKLNLKLFDLNTDMDVLYKEIGKLVYMSHSGEDAAAEELQEKINEADGKMQEIAEIKEQIAALSSSKKCGVCGCECDSSAAFCSKCGASF